MLHANLLGLLGPYLAHHVHEAALAAACALVAGILHRHVRLGRDALVARIDHDGQHRISTVPPEQLVYLHVGLPNLWALLSTTTTSFALIRLYMTNMASR